jgi:hypothetical protein
MRHASFKTTDKYYTDLRLHDLSQAISRLSGPTGPVEEAICQATGTEDAGPVRCHQNRHHSVHETVQSGASGCESEVKDFSHSTNDKPRREAGLCDTVLDRASKRVRRFERPTCTLAMCKHTDAAASTELISCGDGKGVTRTDTSGMKW